MTSILTNNGAMVALQTLKGINNQLTDVQSQISTGKKVASAKDNAAVWAISKVMEADVTGFSKIAEGLAVGESTVAVARDASETVTDLLTEMKGKIVQAQDPSADRAKIQDDITALTNQISSVVGAAQFNGVNLVDGTNTTGIGVLGSLDRDASGVVTSRAIDVDSQNLSVSAGTDLLAGGSAVITPGGTSTATQLNAGDATVIGTLDFQDNAGAAGASFAQRSDSATVNPGNAAGLLAGDEFSMSIGTSSGNYVVREGDTADSVLAGLKNSLQDAGVDTSDFTLDVSTAGALTVTNNTASDISFDFSVQRGDGGLSGLSTLDVNSNPTQALTDIEAMIQTSVDAAAAFGTRQAQLETQGEFVSKLADNLKAGIGSMVDADMEEASARLQALQVQQQLGIQSLSIANQAPQSVLSLFR